MEGSDLVVRPYLKGDEEKIAGVFERCYSGYSGYVRRTPEFWLWFNLRRPGVRAEGILIAERNGKPVGSVTLTPAGELLDPCYEPGEDGYEIFRRLLKASEELAVRMGIERLVLNVPYDDQVTTRVCREASMRQKEMRRTFSINIANRRLFLSQVLAGSRPPSGDYLLDVRRGSHSVERLRLEVSERSFRVTNEEGKVDVRIRIQEGTLAALVFNGLGIQDWVLGRVSCSPFWKMPMALGLLRNLKLGSKWFVPRGGTF